jgi:2-dehydropantoate 2-reductase
VRVAVIGAGALGRTYGVALAQGGADVAFVVQDPRRHAGPIRTQELPNGLVREIAVPRVTVELPDADVALLCVRAEQIASVMRGVLSDSPVPIVSLTPLLPRSLAAIAAVSQAGVAPAMPSVAAEPRGAVIAYFRLPLTPTRIDREGCSSPALILLADALTRGGIPARIEANASARNAATTVAFFPLGVALSLAGSARRLAHDVPLLNLMQASCRECGVVARRIGPVEPGVALLVRLLAPGAVAAITAVASWASPRALGFLEDHFGSKLSAQHGVLGDEIIALGRDHQLAMTALETLLERARTSARN